MSEVIDVDAEDNDEDGIVLADSSLVADVMEACNDWEPEYRGDDKDEYDEGIKLKFGKEAPAYNSKTLP